MDTMSLTGLKLRTQYTNRNIRDIPCAWRSFIHMRCLQDGEDTGRDWRWEGIIERPYRLSGGYLLDLRDFLDVWNEPANIITTNMLNGRETTHSFSFTALSWPSLLQNWSKVASSGPCSLTRTCQFAPSPEALAREKVFTEPLWNDFPCFQAGTESKIERAAAIIDSSEGISVKPGQTQS